MNFVGQFCGALVDIAAFATAAKHGFDLREINDHAALIFGRLGGVFFEQARDGVESRVLGLLDE